MSGRRRVAVVGAGASGLAALRCCLAEGLDPVALEREDDLGGLWNYSEDSKPGKGSIYNSCVINTSKEMMAFSDFPVPAEFPPFMPHGHVLRYLRLYAEHFRLAKYIRFGVCVESVRRAPDYARSGRWEVVTRRTEDTQSELLSVELFDAVMVCTGHHVYPNIPTFPELANFRGATIHSHDYKRAEPFAGKRVLVIGVGNSAVDIAVDLSHVASKVFVSTRRGAWVISRMGPLGYPADALANSRFAFSLPRTWLQSLVETMANFRFDHKSYGLQASHRALEAHPTINDELPYRIMVGAISIKPDVATFTPSGVLFTDGTCEEQIDCVVMATGYRYQYNFLDESVLDIRENESELYRYVFPPHHPHPTMSVIGLVQPIGSVLPIAEMQARWATRVVTGQCHLPSEADRMHDVTRKRQLMASQYISTVRHKLQTFWISYMDEIATEIHVRPNLCRLFLSDPGLALRCFFGPCVPAQYRLGGPGANPKQAALTIRGCLSNNMEAIRTRSLSARNPEEPTTGVRRPWLRLVVGMLLALAICALLCYLWCYWM